MVIKSVAFAGKLEHGCLRITVEESYCGLHHGNWRFRLFSCSAKLPQKTRMFCQISCSLVQSRQLVGQSTVLSNAPLHICPISVPSTGTAKLGEVTATVPLEYLNFFVPGESEWLQFNSGSQSFTLNFEPVKDPAAQGQKVYDWFVCGLFHFEQFQ